MKYFHKPLNPFFCLTLSIGCFLLSNYANAQAVDKKQETGTAATKPISTFGVTAPTSKKYPKGFESAPIYQDLYGKDGAYSTMNPNAEILDKRDVSSRHFLTDDGKVAAIIGAGRVHYLEDGLYKTVLPNLIPSSEEGIYGFMNPYNDFKTFYGQNNQKGLKFLLENEAIKVWKNQGVTYLDANYNTLSQSVFAQANGRQDGTSKVYYTNIANGIDAEVEQNGEGFETSYILQNANFFANVPTNTHFVAFTETVELPTGWRAKYDDNQGESMLVFVDATGKQKFAMQRPMYFEKNGQGTDAHTFGTYRFTQNDTQVTVQYLAEATWLLQSSRQFPIVIDPTTTVFSPNTTSSYYTGHTYGGTCGGTGGGTFYLGFFDGSLGNDYYNAYTRFDITSIPDNACVYNSQYEAYQNTFTNGSGSDNALQFYVGNLSPLTTDPILGATTCTMINNAINGGGFYKQWDVFGTCAGVCTDYDETNAAWKVMYNSTAANANITSCLVQNYFVVGLDYNPESHTDPSWNNNDEYLQYAGSASANRPKLTVVYYLNNVAATSVASSTICTGGSATLSVTGGTLADGTWTWYAGGCGSGSAVGTGASITVSPTTTTTYYVRAENLCQLTLCASATVTVNPDPVAQTIVFNVASGTNVCVGAGMSATFSGGSGGAVTITDAYEYTINAGIGWAAYTPGTVITATAAMIGSNMVQIRTRRTATGSGCDNSVYNTVQWTVIPLHAIALSSANNTQTVCPNFAIANIAYNVTGGATGAGVTGLPSGVTGSFSGGVLTISGTPTVSGTYNYTVTTTGNACTAATATGTITVRNLLGYVNLQFPGSAAICPSNTLTVYGQTYAAGVTEAAGAGAGIEAQLGYSTTNTNPNTWTTWQAATFNTQSGNNDEYASTLSGLAAGTYYYTYRYRLNACEWQYSGTAGAWATGTNGVLTVNPNHAIALTSAGATTTQTVCPNSAITNITYSVTGGGTGAGVTGLPTGVSGSFSGGVFTISGTPTVSGTYNYTVTTSGNGCTVATATGAITVRNLLGFVNLQFPATATICPSGSFTAYGQTYGLGVTEAAGAGAGIVAELGYSSANTDPSTWTTWQAATFNTQSGNNDEYASTLSGLSAGTYYYAYRYRLNGCQNQYGGTSGAWTTGTSGVLTVQPNHTIALTSANNNQTKCVSQQAITNITYNVGGGGTGASVTGLPAGVTGSYSAGVFTISGTPTASGTFNYTVTTAGNSCTAATATGTITVNSLPTPTITNNTGTTVLTCTTPSISLTATSGTTYAWSGGSPTNVATTSITTPNTYTVTATNANGCFATASIVITQDITTPTPANAAQTNVSCNGGTNGSVTISGGSGATPYSICTGASCTSFGTAQASGLFGSLAQGAYVVRVTSANGCTSTIAVSITQPTVITGSASAGTISCNGSTTTLTATASGGTGAFQYANNGGTFQGGNTFTVGNGSYVVTVKDANNCTTNLAAVNVTQPTAVSFMATPTNPDCNGGTGSILVTASGGSGTYQYQINGGGFVAQSNPYTFSALTAAAYNVQVRDANGCAAAAQSISITQPTALTITGSSPTQPTCNGANNGQIVVNATGGTGTYTYSSNNGGSYAANGGTFTGLSAGTYTLIVKDALNCTSAPQTITLNSPSSVTFTYSTSNPACNGGTGSILFSASGGSGGYQYSTDNGMNYSGNSSLGGYSPATYTLIVKDINNCLSAAQTATITQPSAVGLSISGTTTICAGNSTTLTANATGGTGLITYNWGVLGANAAQTVSPTATTIYTVTATDANSCATSETVQVVVNPLPTLSVTNISNTCPAATAILSTAVTTNGTAAFFTNAACTAAYSTPNAAIAGTYYVKTTSAAGCTATASFDVTITVCCTNPVFATPVVVDLTCIAGGSISLTQTSGSTVTAYAWTGTTQTTEDITGLTAGTYTLTATTSGGCSATVSATVGINTAAPAITLSNDGPLTCTKTSVTLTPTGTGATYAFSGGSASVSTPNTYTVTATYANGCTTTASTVVTQDIAAPAITLSNDGPLTCTKTSVTLTPTGTGATYAFSGGSATVTTPATYTVTATYANGCTTTASTIVTQDIAAPAITMSNDGPLTCTKTSVTLTPTGTGATYAFSGGSATVTTPATYTVTATYANGCTTTASTVVTQDIAAPAITMSNDGPLTCTKTSVTLTPTGTGATYAFSGGSASVSTPNTYTVTATYANGCTTTASTIVTQNIAAPAITLSNDGPLTCTKTSVTLTPTGTGATYAFSGGSATVTTPATYTVTATYANGCTTTASTVVTQDIAAPAITLSNDGPLTCTKTSVTLTPTGTGATYAFSGGSATVTTPATYTVTATYANGCTTTASTVVTQDIAAPAITLSNDGPLTCTKTSVTLTPTGTGATYAFSGGSATVTTPATYTVTATYANGCTITASTIVTQDIAAPAITLSNDGPLTCTNTSVTLTPTGTGATYAFSGGSATVTTPATYTVTATYANGCTTTASTIVTQDIAAPAVTMSNDGLLTCTKTSVTLTPTGTGATYAFSGGSATVTTPATYTVTATYANGCTTTASTIVTQDIAAPAITLSNDGPLTCTKTSVTLTPTGTGATYAFSGGSASVSTPNTYTVTATYANGCTTTASTIVTQNIAAPAITLSNDGPLTCTKTSVTLTPTGTGATYAFSGGSATVTTPATYIVTATYANGCTTTASTVVTQDIAAPAITMSNDGPLTCTKTSVTLTPTGTGATYAFSGGSATVTTPATYTVTATYANGCTTTASTIVTQDIAAPAITLSNDGPLTCTKTSVTLTPTGTGATYAFSGGSASVSTPNTYTVTATYANGCTTTASTIVTQDIAAPAITMSNDGPLTCTKTSVTLTPTGTGATYAFSGGSATVTTPATYTVTATYANGCTTTASTIVTQNIVAPAAATFTPAIVNLTCATGSIAIAASSATAGVTYNFNGTNTANYTAAIAGNYTVTITGANGCTTTTSITVTGETTAPTVTVASADAQVRCNNPTVTLTATPATNIGVTTYAWSSGATGTGATATTILPNTYTVTVTANGCTATSSIIVTRNTTTPVVGISGANSIGCVPTSVTLTAVGNGNSFVWSSGATAASSGLLSPTSTTVYTVTVTLTANGCTATATKQVVYAATFPVINIMGSTSFCSGSSTTLMASPGFASYVWSNGISVRTNTINTGGVYTVTVTAINGCSTTKTTTMTMNTAPTVSVSSNSPICTGSTMNITATVSGSPVAGTVSWVGPNGFTSTTPVASGSSTLSRPIAVSAIGGVYIARATNACGTRSVSTTTQVRNPIAITIAIQNASALGGATGSATITAAAGCTYSWSSGETTNYIRNKPAGQYTVTVTPPAGNTTNCVATRTIVIQ
jgi:large repetitive protein